jgi:hypothetical protein
VDARDEIGATALHAAAHAGQVVCVSILVDAGAALEAATLDGETPLHMAAAAGQHECVSRLCRARASLAALAGEQERTPLHFAAASNELECCSRLLAAGADVDAADALGSTPLHDAAGASAPPPLPLALRTPARGDVSTHVREPPARGPLLTDPCPQTAGAPYRASAPLSLPITLQGPGGTPHGPPARALASRPAFFAVCEPGFVSQGKKSS